LDKTIFTTESTENTEKKRLCVYLSDLRVLRGEEVFF